MSAAMTGVHRGWLAVLLVVAVGACMRENRSDADTTAVATPAPPPPAAEARPGTVSQGDSVVAMLETGCGGGVTGGGGGTFVTADGRFYRYERNGPPPNAKRALTFVRKDSARAASLVQAAEQAGIARITYSEPSNMTCHLSLDRGGASHEVAWAMGSKPSQIAKLDSRRRRSRGGGALGSRFAQSAQSAASVENLRLRGQTRESRHPRRRVARMRRIGLMKRIVLDQAAG